MIWLLDPNTRIYYRYLEYDLSFSFRIKLLIGTLRLLIISFYHFILSKFLNTNLDKPLRCKFERVLYKIHQDLNDSFLIKIYKFILNILIYFNNLLKIFPIHLNTNEIKTEFNNLLDLKNNRFLDKFAWSNLEIVQSIIH